MSNITTDEYQVSTAPVTRLNFFSRREMAELPKLLLPGETILAVISGTYTAGTAILCVTSKRLLLVDKKIIRLLFEDIRFESIKEVGYSQQAFMASVKFFYAGREMQFRSWYRAELRTLAQFVQQKMFEVREGKVAAKQITDALLAEDPDRFQSRQAPATPNQAGNEQLEQYLNDRITRWKRADRIVDTLAMSVKTGRQILSLEVSR